MNTHYLSTSHTNPIFYIFSQSFEADQKDPDLQSKWQAVQDKAWVEFWQREGHELLKQKWHKYYPEAIEESSEWQELWEQHASSLNAKFWHIFSCAFENYQSLLVQSFQSEEEQVEEHLEDLQLSEEEPYFTANDDPNDLDEEQQLKLLGLPTSFGSQPRSKSRKSKKQPIQDYSSDSSDLDSLLTMADSALHAIQGGSSIKKSKKKLQQQKKLLSKMPEFMRDDNLMLKYWFKRFSLFSRFDQGIRLDRESWFSVTPEKIAKQTARRLSCDLIVDAFCGCGGNAIQFATTCSRVIAIDIDADKLAMAKHNAAIYGVADKIEFIHADFLQFAKSTHLRPNVVFLSPPWGGPDYLKQISFDIERSLLPVGASALMQHARRLSTNVGFFLPRNSMLPQVIALSGVGQKCEVEHNFLDTRLVAITAYFGRDLIKN